MPYIKKSLRPPFDEVILAIKKGNDGYIPVALDLALEPFKRTTLSGLLALDGCVNYLISKLLHHEQNPRVYKQFVIGLLDRIYVRPICYFNINRLLGLLDCMIIEFTTRSWGNDGNAVEMFEDLQRFYRGQYKQYEKKKRKENGDI